MSTILCTLVPPYAVDTDNGFGEARFEHDYQKEVARKFVVLSKCINAWGPILTSTIEDEFGEKEIGSLPTGILVPKVLSEFKRTRILERKDSGLAATDKFILRIWHYINEEEIKPDNIKVLRQHSEKLHNLVEHPNPRSEYYYNGLRKTVFELDRILIRYGLLPPRR